MGSKGHYTCSVAAKHLTYLGVGVVVVVVILGPFVWGARVITHVVWWQNI